MDLKIKAFKPGDEEAIWQIIQPVIARGDTYAFAPNASRKEMLDFWCDSNKLCFVAQLENEIVGTFFIKPNHPGLGAHIANAGYIVSQRHHGKGIGKAMGLFSLEAARRAGYKAMQFNMVVKSNTTAVALWQKLGFEIIGEIPEAFRHQQLGLVNAYVMYRKL